MKKVPVKVYDEEGNEIVKEVSYSSVVDEQTGMVRWQMEPGQDLSGNKIHLNADLRIVSFGGGTGLPVVLKGLKRYLFPESDNKSIEPSSKERLTAIVAMTDDGGSSGRLRHDLHVLPPGDIRNCLIGLSKNESRMTKLLQFRFEGDNGLSGHNLGNLILAALSEINHSFFKGVSDLSSILAIHGQILPATDEYAVLRAELDDGSMLEGESRINASTRPIRRIMIEPENAKPLDQSLDAINKARGIIIGPGSLYTSILPNLMIQGVADAIRRSPAGKILIANLMTEPEETRGFTVEDHIRVIHEHVGSGMIDHVLINKTSLPIHLQSMYRGEEAEASRYDLEAIRRMGVNPVEADLLSIDDQKVRHDSEKLARNILKLLQ